MLPNRFVIGGMPDVSVPSWPNLGEISLGGTSTFVSPALGQVSYTENVLHFGTLRGRVGYAPGNWLVLRDRWLCLDLRSADADPTRQLRHDRLPFLWRLGWAAGAGVEFPLAPNWTASLEYLYTKYGNSSRGLRKLGQRFQSDLAVAQLRMGVNYRFGADQKPGNDAALGPLAPSADRLELSRADHVRLAGLSSDPVAVCGPTQPDRPRAGPRNMGRHAVCRHTIVARRRSLGQPGARSGFRPRRHPRRGRIFRAAKPTSSASPTLMRACSACSCGRPSILAAKPESRRRHQSVCRPRDRQSSCADGRQVRDR